MTEEHAIKMLEEFAADQERLALLARTQGDESAAEKFFATAVGIRAAIIRLTPAEMMESKPC